MTLLLLAASVVILAAATAGHAQSTSSRQLTIAIVDPRRTTVERNEFRAQMAGVLIEAVRDVCGPECTVHPVYVGGRDARVKLNGGNYDAALVIGTDRPLALRRLELITLAGEMAGPNGAQPVSLVVRGGDEILNVRLRAAFSRLLATHPDPYVAARSGRTVTQLGG